MTVYGVDVSWLETVIPGIEAMADDLDPREAYPCWLCMGDGDVGTLVDLGEWTADYPPRFRCEACGGIGIDLELGVAG